MKKPRIFYFCYSHNRPSGGQKHTYRHVDILNDHGFEAAIVHPGTNFRLKWFENSTRVLDMAQFLALVDPLRDFFVLPEDLGDRILDLPGRKVIFNKNVYHGFNCYNEQELQLYSCHASEVVAAFAVSRHNKEVLQYTYPNLLIKRMYAEIRTDIFRFCPLAAKLPRILYPHKARETSVTIRHIIESRAQAGLNDGAKFHWQRLEGLTEKELASVLTDSFMLVFPSVHEGLPRLVLEAMASGCLVAAYANGPASEILPKAYSFQHSDLIGIVGFIEEAMLSYPNNLAAWAAPVQEGLSIAQEFSPERQTKHVLDAWSELIQM